MAISERRAILIIHIIQFILIHAIIIIAVVRIFLPGMTRTRADTWVLGVSAKSMVIMFYMVLTEYVRRLQRFASVKANMILSIVETVFWVAAVVMPAMNFNKCTKTGCTFTGVTIGLAAVLALLSIPVTFSCFRDWRAQRGGRGTSLQPLGSKETTTRV